MERKLPAALRRRIVSDAPSVLDMSLFLLLAGMIGFLVATPLGPIVSVGLAYAIVMADRIIADDDAGARARACSWRAVLTTVAVVWLRGSGCFSSASRSVLTHDRIG